MKISSGEFMLYREMHAFVFCEWLKRNGFIHYWEEQVIILCTTDLYDVYQDGPYITRLSLQNGVKALADIIEERVLEKPPSVLQVFKKGLLGK